MSTIPHPPGAAREAVWVSLLRAREMWASIAITAMWAAVAVAALWGPDFVRASNDGNTTTIPSGIFVGLFASIGTWASYVRPRASAKPTVTSKNGGEWDDELG